VHSAIREGAARLASAPPLEARPPPAAERKAKKKASAILARPLAPFGSSGLGLTDGGYESAVGAGSSSRVFAVAPARLRLPVPFQFAEITFAVTIPEGQVAAPPPARPG
jgi:hypothetical protein